MKTVHKFQLPLEGVKELELCEEARLVRCEYILPHKALYLWIEQPLNPDAARRKRLFTVVKSGQPIPKSYEHIGSALDTFAPEAYHLYELPQVTAVPASTRAA